jgi:membrane-bound lytic murein transglycosylase D
MIYKKLILLFYVIVVCFLTAKAQPLTQGLGSEYQLRLAKVDSNTLQWRNKLYPKTDAGNLNTYGFNPNEIPVYSDSTYALRLSLLEMEIPMEYNQQVRNYIDLYANRRRNLISKVLSTSKLYFPIFEEVFDRENVPMEFKYLAVIESALNQRAI